MTVSATGATPLSYQWRATNAAVAGSFTNIPGATTNTLTLTGVSTNFYEVVVTNIAGAQTSSVVLVTTLKAVTNSAVTNLWQVAAGQSGYPWLSPSDKPAERGIAYDTNSQRASLVFIDFRIVCSQCQQWHKHRTIKPDRRHVRWSAIGKWL